MFKRIYNQRPLEWFLTMSWVAWQWLCRLVAFDDQMQVSTWKNKGYTVPVYVLLSYELTSFSVWSTGTQVGIAWLKQLCQYKASLQSQGGQQQYVSGTGVSSISKSNFISIITMIDGILMIAISSWWMESCGAWDWAWIWSHTRLHGVHLSMFRNRL